MKVSEWEHKQLVRLQREVFRAGWGRVEEILGPEVVPLEGETTLGCMAGISALALIKWLGGVPSKP